jgi:hypothetical protein
MSESRPLRPFYLHSVREVHSTFNTSSQRVTQSDKFFDQSTI